MLILQSRWLYFCIVITTHFCTCQSDEIVKEKGDNLNENQNDSENERITGEIKSTNSWEAYKVLLETQRKAHMEIIKQLLSIGHTEKQYDLLNVVSRKIIEVLQESKAKLTEAGVSAGDEFPEDENKRDYLSQLIQNSLLFGDMALRFPTFIHRIFDKNKSSQVTVKWCFEFVNKLSITDGTSSEQTLYLASQELNLIKREENYENPFVEEAEIKLSQLVKEEMKNSKKLKKNKGPRLSGRKVEL